MTEPTIPSWSSMKDYYKQSRSVLFPTPSSFQKRDPRIDSSRSKAANSIEDPDLKEEIKTDAHHTKRDNPRFTDSLQFPDRNPVPQPQPERKDIPVNRENYEDDQYATVANVDEMLDDDHLLEHLTNDPYGPSVSPYVLNRILTRLREYYSNNAWNAAQGRVKTREALGAPLHWDGEQQQSKIEPGRR